MLDIRDDKPILYYIIFIPGWILFAVIALLLLLFGFFLFPFSIAIFCGGVIWVRIDIVFNFLKCTRNLLRKFIYFHDCGNKC
jgi:hypothetical protein